MRNVTVPLLVILVVIGLVGAGVAARTGLARPAPPADRIDLREGETHTMALEANPSTGYGWTAKYDERFLELVSRTYDQSSNLLGAGGREIFVFRALAAGATTVLFEYARPWEGKAIRTETFKFNITG